MHVRPAYTVRCLKRAPVFAAEFGEFVAGFQHVIFMNCVLFPVPSWKTRNIKK